MDTLRDPGHIFEDHALVTSSHILVRAAESYETRITTPYATGYSYHFE